MLRDYIHSARNYMKGNYSTPESQSVDIFFRFLRGEITIPELADLLSSASSEVKDNLVQTYKRKRKIYDRQTNEYGQNLDPKIYFKLNQLEKVLDEAGLLPGAQSEDKEN